MTKTKGKNLGKGLAALINEKKKKPKNIKDKTEPEPEKQEIEEEALKQWAEAKVKEKAVVDEDKDDKAESSGKGTGSNLDDKKKAYENILKKYTKRKEQRYKKTSKDIDPDIPVWKEEEYTSPLEFDYFDRNAKGSAKERYEKLLQKRKK